MQLLKDTATAEIYRHSTDILVLKFKNDQLVQREHAQEIDVAFMDVIENRDHFFIIDALDVQSNMTSDAQRYFSKESTVAEYTLASAILINNLSTRLIASVFMKVYNPVYPSKTFGNEQAALNWFESLR